MSKIVPYLYLANYNDAMTYKDGCFFIVNCTADLPMIHEYGMRLAVDDNKTSKAICLMMDALPQVVQRIHLEITQKKNVLVHCLAGRQRSASVVAAYLIAHYNMTVAQAIQFVRSKKKDAFFGGANFEDALHFFELCQFHGADNVL